MRDDICTYICTYWNMSHSGMLIMHKNVAGFLSANLVVLVARTQHCGIYNCETQISGRVRCLLGLQSSSSYTWI